MATNPNKIWKILKEKMSHTCDNEICWINKTIPEKSKIFKKKIFAPEMPDKWKVNINEWLNSTDILQIMKQYEETYPYFKFYGPSPIDFNTITYNNICVWPEICKFSVKKCLKKKNTKIGFIFNTDTHNQSGSHWVSLFLDLDKKFIFFFDSTGNTQQKEITTLINKIVEQCKKENIKLHVDNNDDIEHQKQNTECGMYSLYLIITLLLNKHNFRDFKKLNFSDKFMEKYRHIYFNIF